MVEVVREDGTVEVCRTRVSGTEEVSGVPLEVPWVVGENETTQVPLKVVREDGVVGESPEVTRTSGVSGVRVPGEDKDVGVSGVRMVGEYKVSGVPVARLNETDRVSGVPWTGVSPGTDGTKDRSRTTVLGRWDVVPWTGVSPGTDGTKERSRVTVSGTWDVSAVVGRPGVLSYEPSGSGDPPAHQGR